MNYSEFVKDNEKVMRKSSFSKAVASQFFALQHGVNKSKTLARMVSND